MINWNNISLAIEHYKSCGFANIDVPWIVSREAIEATLPENKLPVSCQFGDLVGSAEQSFIQLMLDNCIIPGKYVTASPCFRDDEVDYLHSKTFFKVEIIHIFKNLDKNFKINEFTGPFIGSALALFCKLTDLNPIMVPTSEGYDIKINDIEVGSYGIRTLKNWTWIYGTGYADPRFSIAINST